MLIQNRPAEDPGTVVASVIRTHGHSVETSLRAHAGFLVGCRLTRGHPELCVVSYGDNDVLDLSEQLFNECLSWARLREPGIRAESVMDSWYTPAGLNLSESRVHGYGRLRTYVLFIDNIN